MEASGILSAAVVLLTAGLVALAIVSGRRYDRLRRRGMRLETELDALEARMGFVLRHTYSRDVERALAAAGRGARLPVEFTSHLGEDALLWDLFEGRLDGYYVEVGAYDGYTFSTTYVLEAVGWTGLLVEPLTERYEECVRRRPGSRVVRAAVSRKGSSGTTIFRSVVGEGLGSADMLSGIAPDSPQEALIDRSGLRYTSIEVPLTTLDSLLGDLDRPIDVAVIDVEGTEADVIDGLDLEKRRPRVLVVEDSSLGRDPALAELLGRHGYEEVARLRHNRFFVHEGETALLEKARRIAGPSPE